MSGAHLQSLSAALQEGGGGQLASVGSVAGWTAARQSKVWSLSLSTRILGSYSGSLKGCSGRAGGLLYCHRIYVDYVSTSDCNWLQGSVNCNVLDCKRFLQLWPSHNDIDAT